MEEALKQGIVLFLFFGISGIAGGVMASNRGRSIIGWSLLCGLFAMFLLVLWQKKPLREVPGKFRQCPACGEWLKWKELRCRYCQAVVEKRHS